MGAALKKNVDHKELSYLRWAAWGVVDIEALERMQRRNYINHVREELKLHGMQLEVGGSANAPYYRVFCYAAPTGAGEKPKLEWQGTSATSAFKQHAFKAVCLAALTRIDPKALATEDHNGS